MDFVDAFTKVAFFANEDDLRRQLSALPKGKGAIAFLSVGYPEEGESDTRDAPRRGTPDHHTPYEEVYEIPFIVRKFVLRPAPALPQS